MTSNKNIGFDENDFQSTSSEHQRLGVANVNAYDPARDFLPPRSYVRSRRQLPIFHSPTNSGRPGWSREVDEGLAAKAVSEQISRGNTWQRTDGRFNDRKPINNKVCTFATT